MKILKLAIAASALSVVASPALANDTVDAENADAENSITKSKKPKKITDRNDPNYIRCRSEPIIGSLSRKRRVCMTNAQWVEHNQAGSKQSKEFVEDNQPGFMMTPN